MNQLEEGSVSPFTLGFGMVDGMEDLHEKNEFHKSQAAELKCLKINFICFQPRYLLNFLILVIQIFHISQKRIKGGQ